MSRRFSDRFTAQSSKVSLSIFSLFCGFLENLARLSLVFVCKKLLAHDFLAFRVIWKQTCRLDFSIFLKPCFYGQTSSGRWNFLHGYDVFFFLDFCFFPYTKKLLKVSDHSVEEIQHESTTLRWSETKDLKLLICNNFFPCHLMVI